MHPVRVLLVCSHPIQYAAPLFRLYAMDSRVDLTVAYCSLQGAQPGLDPEFGTEVQWNIPLLDGYRWIHPRNRAFRPGLQRFLGLVNPGLWALVRGGGFEVVVCFGYSSASMWIAALAAKVSGTSLVFTTDASTLMPRSGARWKLRFKRVLLPRIFGFGDAAFGCSSRTMTLLRDLGVPSDRCFLTHYVVDNDFFVRASSAADAVSVRQGWRVPPGAPVALFAGKLVSWKRPRDVLEAAARIPALYVIFAGEGPLRNELEARANNSDLTGRVRFLGFVNQQELPGVYAGSDVLVLPSAHEPFGLVVNEAYCCGVPAIVSDACGAAGDLVRDGETGYVVPVGDVARLAERMSSLVEHPSIRRGMGERARRRIAEWGPGQNVEAFVEACATIAATRRRSWDDRQGRMTATVGPLGEGSRRVR